jgi:mannose-1-phosphate guanylyltransferase
VDGEEEKEADAASGQGKSISVTVLASDVSLAAETLVRSCIVLPNVSTVRNMVNGRVDRMVQWGQVRV